MTKLKIALTAGTFALLASCGAAIPADCGEYSCSRTEADDGTHSDDSVDAKAPPRVTIPLPHIPTLPNDDDATGEPIDEEPAPDEPHVEPTPIGENSYGVEENLSCQEFVDKFWKVGAKTNEEAPGPLATTLYFTTTVLSVEGSIVTLNTKLETPDSSKNVDENLTFDACTDGHMSAVPVTQERCIPKPLGKERVSVGGKTYQAKKYSFSNCKTEGGDTFNSTVWRVAELPLWGVVKRQVTGTVVPKELGGKISAQTKAWIFQ